MPNAASHSRVAFFSIASNTGARSPGEELMTCNTSELAVCCSKASRVSVISRAFSIAMTACPAKFCNSAICLSENGRYLLAEYCQSTEQDVVLPERDGNDRPGTAALDRVYGN